MKNKIKEIASSTAIELPDFQPEVISEIDKKILDQQNQNLKNDGLCIEKKNKPFRVDQVLHRENLFVIKDNELYVSQDSRTTPLVSEAKFFNNINAAEIFLQRKLDEHNRNQLLMPIVQELEVSHCKSIVYKEV